MTVNLDLLKKLGRTVVHCVSEDHAKMFMQAMWDQYPGQVNGVWSRGQTNWNKYREEHGGIYYLPRIVRNRTEIPHCQSTDEDTALCGDYTLVEFIELVKEFDLGEFDCDSADIKSLFGMG